VTSFVYSRKKYSILPLQQPKTIGGECKLHYNKPRKGVLSSQENGKATMPDFSNITITTEIVHYDFVGDTFLRGFSFLSLSVFMMKKKGILEVMFDWKVF
jgi:hypothetical protein